MREVKVYPKYKCDFCKKRAVKASMIKHEIICWYNPNRKCRTCDEKGFFYEQDENGYSSYRNNKIPCEDCKSAKEIKDKILINPN